MQHILATNANALPIDWGGASAFHKCTEGEMFEHLERAGLWVGPRPSLELMPSFRQLIPYVVLVDRPPDSPNVKVVCYRRTKAGDESRLHEKHSIGLGGHVDLGDLVAHGADIHLRFTLEHAGQREVQEEVKDPHGPLHRQWVGVVVDNDNEVGRVHLGVVWVWMMPHSFIPRSSEDSLTEVSYLSLSELRSLRTLEPWSALLLNSEVFK